MGQDEDSTIPQIYAASPIAAEGVMIENNINNDLISSSNTNNISSSTNINNNNISGNDQITSSSDKLNDNQIKDEYVYGGSETKFPSSIKYIMGNEICERYSYYSLKSILTNYLIHFMGYSSSRATAIGHGFNSGAYFFTLLGAYVADGRLGKFKTILYFSIIYCIGAAIFSISAIPNVTGPREGERSPWGLIIGLSGIAIGTGGIKPVVSAFCGDQFGPHQKRLLQNLFQIFYWCVNLGSFFSSILSPILRTNVGYWCAFMVPAVILFVSIIVFVLGKNKYVNRKPQGSVLSTLFGVIGNGIKESFKKSIKGSKYNDHYYQDSWLDRARSKYSLKTVSEVKLVLRVLTLFTPLPFFWALYDQTGTRWNVQANSMDRKIGSLTIDSEIINAINPLLVMIFVPLFEYGIYRPLQKRNINFSPLRRMGTGMFLSVIAFYIAAIVQLDIDNKEPNSVSIALQIPQYIVLTAGEVLLSITGLEVAYSNSPKNMKSIVMAGWLLTVSIGNLFDAFVIELIHLDEYILDFLFGSVMLIFIVIFIVIAYHFKPIDPAYLESLNNQNDNSINDEYSKEMKSLNKDNNNNNNNNNNKDNNKNNDINSIINNNKDNNKQQ